VLFRSDQAATRVAAAGTASAEAKLNFTPRRRNAPAYNQRGPDNY
jgi:hypothetical protein